MPSPSSSAISFQACAVEHRSPASFRRAFSSKQSLLPVGVLVPRMNSSPNGSELWSERSGGPKIEQGGCSRSTPGNPVNIPHDIENRGVATGIDQKLNPEVSGGIRPSPQVAEFGSAQPLKVETRVRTPLGLPGKPQVRGPVRFRPAELSRCRPAFVPRPTASRHALTDDASRIHPPAARLVAVRNREPHGSHLRANIPDAGPGVREVRFPHDSL
jgi:hypothetical protein